MDKDEIRNRLIEEQFEEGKVQNGFTFSFIGMSSPPDTIALEVRMADATLRLFFTVDEFKGFVSAATVSLQEVLHTDSN